MRKLMLVPMMGFLSLGALACGGGDPDAGRKLALDPNRGDCLICHQVHAGSAEQQGNVGPLLMGVADRIGKTELFERIKDMRRFNPETMMPPYGSTEKLYRVAGDVKGVRILTDEEIEDVVAWLKTLKVEADQ